MHFYIREHIFHFKAAISPCFIWYKTFALAGRVAHYTFSSLSVCVLGRRGHMPLSVVKNTILLQLLGNGHSHSIPLCLEKAWRNLFVSEGCHHPGLHARIVPRVMAYYQGGGFMCCVTTEKCSKTPGWWVPIKNRRVRASILPRQLLKHQC